MCPETKICLFCTLSFECRQCNKITSSIEYIIQKLEYPIIICKRVAVYSFFFEALNPVTLVVF